MLCLRLFTAMISTTHPPNSRTAADAGLPEHLLSMLAAGLSYFQARLELAGIEGKEALVAYGLAAGLIGAAAALLVFGYIFAWIGIIALIAHFSHAHWGWIALGVGVLHFAGAVGCALAAKARCGKPVFDATLREFRKDQEWLNSPRTTANRN